MERVIKFKAWHKTEKVLCDVTVLTDKGAFLVGVKPGEDQVIPDMRCVIPAPPEGRFCNMDEIELIQFTGLHDRNGKEIYEGDIVRRYHLQGDVAWHEERAMFIVHDGFNEPLFNDILGIEIIGNLYENPELLNQ